MGAGIYDIRVSIRGLPARMRLIRAPVSLLRTRIREMRARICLLRARISVMAARMGVMRGPVGPGQDIAYSLLSDRRRVRASESVSSKSRMRHRARPGLGAPGKQ